MAFNVWGVRERSRRIKLQKSKMEKAELLRPLLYQNTNKILSYTQNLRNFTVDFCAAVTSLDQNVLCLSLDLTSRKQDGPSQHAVQSQSFEQHPDCLNRHVLWHKQAVLNPRIAQ